MDERSARRRDLYLTTNNTHNRQTSLAPVEFEPKISGGERPQTYALDRAATGTGSELLVFPKYISPKFISCGGEMCQPIISRHFAGENQQH